MPKKVIISLVAVFILALIGGGVWYLKQERQAVNVLVTENQPAVQNENEQTNANQLQGNVAEQNPENLELNTDNWLTYRNEEYGFEVKYPWGWVVENSNNGIGFGTIQSKSGGYSWGINKYDSKKNTEGLIQELGSQFNDRLEKREKIIIDNKEGLLITITTPSHKDWISKSIFVKNNNFVFEISNGAQDRSIFDIFFHSFKFLN